MNSWSAGNMMLNFSFGGTFREKFHLDIKKLKIFISSNLRGNLNSEPVVVVDMIGKFMNKLECQEIFMQFDNKDIIFKITYKYAQSSTKNMLNYYWLRLITL